MKKIKILFIVLTLLSATVFTALFVSAGNAPTEYSDDFSNDTKNYTSSGVSYKIADGTLSVTGDGIVGIKDRVWDYAAYEFTIDMTKKTEWAGVLFNKPSPTAGRDDAGYMLYIRPNGSVELYIAGGVIAKGQADFKEDKIVDIKIEVYDGNIKVYLDGSDKTVIDCDHSAFSYGYFSFVSYMGGTVSYDNLKITPIPSDGVIRELSVSLGDGMISLGAGEAVKLDVATVPLDAGSGSITWSITDVYGNETNAAKIVDGWLVAGEWSDTVRITASSKEFSDTVDVAITRKSPDRKNASEYSEIFVTGKFGTDVMTSGTTLPLAIFSEPFGADIKNAEFTVTKLDGTASGKIENGTLSADGEGKLKIAAKLGELTAEAVIEVKKEVSPEKIKLTAENDQRIMAVGGAATMNVYFYPYTATPENVNFTVLGVDGKATKLAEIDSSGTLTAKEKGTVRVRAELTDRPEIMSEWIMTVGEVTTDGRSAMPTMKYAFFSHYVPELTVDKNGRVIMDENKLANAFNAEAFADEMAEMGVEYIVFTAFHYRMVCLFDSQAMKDWDMSGHYTERDMIGEMIDAVQSKGINVVLYVHPFDGYDFATAAEGVKVGWGTSLKPNLSPYYNKDFDHEKWNNFINDVFGEVMAKYGDRICGIWVDEGNMFDGMAKAVDFDRLKKTLTSYNENLITFQNFYGFDYGFDIKMREYWKHDEFADHSGKSLRTYRERVPAAIIGSDWWSSGVANGTTVPYSGRALFLYQVLQASANEAGGIQWAAGPLPGEEGGYQYGVMETMQVFNAYLNPIAWTVKGTVPSASYFTKENKTVNTVGWGVAATSADGKYEFIHVLDPENKAVDGKTLTLPAPADGKIFKSAMLAVNCDEVTLSQTESAVTLTLTGDNEWNDFDTVIVLTVDNGEVEPDDTEAIESDIPETEAPESETSETEAPEKEGGCGSSVGAFGMIAMILGTAVTLLPGRKEQN